MSALLGNLDELVAQVRRRAEQRALAIEHRGEEEAKGLLTAADARVQEEVQRIAEGAERAAASERREARSAAEARRRRRALDAREAQLERVWEAAERALAEVALDRDTLARLAREAAAALGGEEVRLRLDAASAAGLDDATVAGWREPDGPALVLDPTPLERGRGLEARSGRSSIDATLSGRLVAAREHLRGEVAAILTGEPRSAR